MRRNAAAALDVSEAACQQATGKTLTDWFRSLDLANAQDLGRRDLVNHVYELVNKQEWWATTIAVEYEKARGLKEKDGQPKGYSVCSTKTIAAPLDLVFAAFGDASVLNRWFGTDTQSQFVDGGTMTNDDGDRWVYSRIRLGKDIRCRWETPTCAAGSQLEVLFADKGKGKTGITLNHTRIQDRAAADQLREGWSRGLESLKAHLEKTS